jgi:hypothetical protein
MTVMAGRCGAAVHGCNDADEFGETVHVVGSAPRLKYVVGQVTHVVSHAVVGIEECLHMPSRVPGRVRMSPSMRIKETDRVVDGFVCVAVPFKMPVRRPAQRTASNYSHILQELDADVTVAEQECEKQLISNTVGAQRREPERRGRKVRLGIQTPLLCFSYRSNTYISHVCYKCTFFKEREKNNSEHKTAEHTEKKPKRYQRPAPR